MAGVPGRSGTGDGPSDGPDGVTGGRTRDGRSGAGRSRGQDDEEEPWLTTGATRWWWTSCGPHWASGRARWPTGTPSTCSGFALTSLVERTGVDPGRVDDVIGGCVTQVGEQSTNVTRNAWVAAGLPQQVPATTVDRQCGSSQQAMHFAAAGVVAGHYDLVVACGVEIMSRVPLASNARGGTGPFPPSFLEQIDGRLWAQFRVAQVLADRVGDHPRGDGRIRAREPSPGGRGLGRGPVRQRGRTRPPEGRGRQADGRPPRDRRGYPS